MANQTLIQVDKLRVLYNQGKTNEVRALEETNVQIFPKEYVMVHGPSGCGKSTLLSAIAGLQAPTYGDVIFRGQALGSMTAEQMLNYHRKEIGMIFQAFYLIPSLNVIDNVCLPRTFMGETVEERRAEGMKLLRRFGIAEQAFKMPGQLSGGQKQRVAIARALINNPEVILADEPVGNLDSESAQNVLNLLKELNEQDKKTVIMVTHNQEHLIYADRIIYMKDGRIIREEVRNEKRPLVIIKQVVVSNPEAEIGEVPPELKRLMESFGNLSPEQLNILLVPFKAKQVVHHVLSNLSDEQVHMAESFLKEIILGSLSTEKLPAALDRPLDEGGGGWNKHRAETFAEGVRHLLGVSQSVSQNPDHAHLALAEYLTNQFHLHLDDTTRPRLENFLRQRIDNQINHFELRQRLDTPKAIGGLGLHKATAEKVVREVEIVMLLKYR